MRPQEETGVDGFKFDAGEPCFLPRKFRTHRPIATPQEYTALYIREVAGACCAALRCAVQCCAVEQPCHMASRACPPNRAGCKQLSSTYPCLPTVASQCPAGQFSGGVSEVRTGHMTQDVAVLTRMVRQMARCARLAHCWLLLATSITC